MIKLYLFKSYYLLARVEDLSVHGVHVNSCQVRLLASEADDSVSDGCQFLGPHCLVNAVSQTGDLVKYVAVAWRVLNNEDNIGSSWNVLCFVQSDAVKLVEDTVGGRHLATDCQDHKTTPMAFSASESL